MSVVAKWREKQYNLLDEFQINKSSREITFSDIKLDFLDGTILDLPNYLEEITIEDTETEDILFVGYVDSFKCPTLRANILGDKELEISLLSPRSMATKRTISIMKTNKLDTILQDILAPLIKDGFKINKIDVADKTVTVNYINNTIDDVLDYMSKRYSFWWNIDEEKGITIIDITKLFNQEVKKAIDETNYYTEILGLESLTPEIEGLDYANVINAKNVRIYYKYDYSFMSEEYIHLKQNGVLTFENPIDISAEGAVRVNADASQSRGINNLLIYYGTESASINTDVNVDGTTSQTIENIGTDDADGKTFTMQYDSFFTNLITGLKYNGTSEIDISSIYTETSLRYATVKLSNWKEINRQKGIISKTGIIEKTLDLSEKWFTTDEIIDYIRNLFINKDKHTNKITMKFDKDNGLSLGDRIDFNLPNYLTQGVFIITDITITASGNKEYEYEVELRNTDLLENYIDLFRATDEEENQEQTATEYIVEFTDTEAVEENHIITEV